MKEGVAHQMKQEQEKQKLEIESLKAAPRAVKAANRANIISAVAILSRIILFFIQQANSNNSNTEIANLKMTINALKVENENIRDSLIKLLSKKSIDTSSVSRLSRSSSLEHPPHRPD